MAINIFSGKSYSRRKEERPVPPGEILNVQVRKLACWAGFQFVGTAATKI